MAKFQAKKTDLTIEIVTLGGEEASLDAKISNSTKSMLDIYEQWADIEKKLDELKKPPHEAMAIQMAMVYDKPKEWWLENLDPVTLQEIVMHVVSTIAGSKKK